MKKLTRPGVLPLFALVSGSIGMLVQHLIRRNAFDHRQLLIPDHPAVVVLYILTALAISFIFLLSQQENKAQAAFPVTPGSKLSAGIMILCAILLTGRALNGAVDRLTVLLAISCVVAVFGLITDWTRLQNRQVTGGFFYGAMALFLLFYTLNQQQHWQLSVQPARLFFPVIACVFLMMGIFYRAYLAVDGKALFQYLFFHYGAMFFSLGAIFDDPLLYGPFTLALLLDPLPTAKGQMALPKNVSLCLWTLKKAGFEAYVVGGCVRDTLLGLVPQDYDMCTNATPEQIAEVFSQYELVRKGEKHGTVSVIIDHQMYEITTFRAEGSYSDSRHPDWVEFVDSLETDLARRDFTVNAMAYSPKTGFIDPFGGEQDLKDGILRTVGNPEDRFTEDALRILRGVRFAVRFRFQPEENTLQAMSRLAGTMDSLARERVFAELKGLLPLIQAEDLIRYAPVITQVIPELASTVDFQQYSPHHAYDVYTHTAHVVEAVPGDLTLRLAALLHDVGKPETFTLDETGKGHFYGHAALGAKVADEVLSRLRAPTELRQQVVTLIENHMIDLPPDKKILRKRLARFGQDTLEKILSLQEADFCSKGTKEETALFADLRALLKEILEESHCLSVKDLAISGKDLMELGITPGPEMGEILNKLLEMVLDETLENEKTVLLQAAEKLGGKL